MKRRQWADNVFVLLIFLSLPMGIMMALYVGAHPDNFITRLVALAGMEATDSYRGGDTIEILAAGCFFLPLALIIGLYYGILRPLQTYGFGLSMRYIRLFFKSVKLLFNPGSANEIDKNPELNEWREVTDGIATATHEQQVAEEKLGTGVNFKFVGCGVFIGVVIIALILVYLWWNTWPKK